MISKLSVKFSTYVFCCTSLGTTNDGNDSHSDDNREQSRYYAFDYIVKLLVRRLTAVQCIVCALHVEVKQIWLRYHKVEILIVHLRQVFGCVGLNCLDTEVFEERPGNAGEEVDVGRACVTIVRQNEACTCRQTDCRGRARGQRSPLGGSGWSAQRDR
jgi:hypothetical protein